MFVKMIVHPNTGFWYVQINLGVQIREGDFETLSTFSIKLT